MVDAGIEAIWPRSLPTSVIRQQLVFEQLLSEDAPLFKGSAAYQTSPLSRAADLKVETRS
jgi:hypothetical protein